MAAERCLNGNVVAADNDNNDNADDSVGGDDGGRKMTTNKALHENMHSCQLLLSAWDSLYFVYKHNSNQINWYVHIDMP